MKFLEQARAFQTALAAQSRIFTSIMLVSGVGLVAAAPFLSYEAATIQCYEAEDNVVIINDGETVIMKGELERKDKEIERFKKRLNALDRRMNCKDVIDDLESDRTELLEQLTECEKSLNDCLSNNSDLKGLQDKINGLLEENKKLKDALESCGTDYSEVDELKAEITKLNKEITVLQRRLSACLEQGNGNAELKNEINALNDEITRLKKLADDYKRRWKLCESEKRESNNSNKLFLAFRLEDREQFQFNKKIFSRTAKNNMTALIYELQLDGKSIERDLAKGKGYYKFPDGGKNYTLKLVRTSKVASYLSITER